MKLFFLKLDLFLKNNLHISIISEPGAVLNECLFNPIFTFFSQDVDNIDYFMWLFELPSKLKMKLYAFICVLFVSVVFYRLVEIN